MFKWHADDFALADAQLCKLCSKFVPKELAEKLLALGDSAKIKYLRWFAPARPPTSAAALHRTAESVARGCSRIHCYRFSYTLALREKLPIRLAPQPMVTVVPYSSAYTTLSASLG